MLRFCLLATLFSFLAVSSAFAKRGAPVVVAPVVLGEVEFRAPHAHMGCVEAWDTKHNELLWRRQIYVVKFKVGLERDVQDCFINALEIKAGTLRVKNERGSEFDLDVDSLNVKVVGGSLVENWK